MKVSKNYFYIFNAEHSVPIGEFLLRSIDVGPDFFQNTSQQLTK